MLTKRINKETISFWESTRDARIKVEKWPSWKRNLKVTQYSVGFDSQKGKNPQSVLDR